MLGNGKKHYVIGKSEDIDEYMEMHGDPRLKHPDHHDTMFFMNADDYQLGYNHDWIRQVADEVKAGTAMLQMISINDDPARVYSQEVQWLEALGLEYCNWKSSWVPKGAAVSDDWIPPRARL